MKPLDDLTTQCIRCGFCLDACPTFKLTGSELESPRGRIYLARSADEGVLDWADTKKHFDRCLGCLACEPACPSAVKYGEILELARERIEEVAPNSAREFVVDSATDPAMMRLGGLSHNAKIPNLFGRFFESEKMEARLPVPEPNNLPNLTGDLPPVIGEVYFLEGCAMRALFPRVHASTKRLLRRIGYTTRVVDAGCCGSMHAHNGYLDEAKERAAALMSVMPDDIPVIVDSAGCGSTMKRYGDLLPGSEMFAYRVKDASEFLALHGLLDSIKQAPGLPGLSVTYHDACHLAHGQGIKEAPRALLKAIPGIEFHELPDSDRCCGSAGIYNIVQPEMARQLLNLKLENAERTKAAIVASGNPGCHAWMAQGAREAGALYVVRHTMEVLEAAFIGFEPFL